MVVCSDDAVSFDVSLATVGVVMLLGFQMFPQNNGGIKYSGNMTKTKPWRTM
jgi:hypothetical protein